MEKRNIRFEFGLLQLCYFLSLIGTASSRLGFFIFFPSIRVLFISISFFPQWFITFPVSHCHYLWTRAGEAANLGGVLRGSHLAKWDLGLNPIASDMIHILIESDIISADIHEGYFGPITALYTKYQPIWIQNDTAVFVLCCLLLFSHIIAADPWKCYVGQYIIVPLSGTVFVFPHIFILLSHN